MKTRRAFNKDLFALGATGVLGASFFSCKNDQKMEVKPNNEENEIFFKLSLAQWSLHKALQAGTLGHLEFAEKAKDLGFEGIEYVSQFFKDKAKDIKYLHEMNVRAKSNGVKQLLIMVDGEGPMASIDSKERNLAIENHKKWIDAASSLACHSIRVNCFGEGSRDEVSKAGIEGLRGLSEIAAKQNINVIVENHGGYSSDGTWMANVIKEVGLSNCGTLPDFGNFCVEREGGKQWGTPCINEYDKYKGVEELMPYAKAVSAKSHDFDKNGNETKIDYKKMLSIVKSHGYKGYIGVEYEGENLGEEEGIIKTRELLVNAAKLI